MVFVKWLVISAITGSIGGLIGTIFNKGISFAVGIHQEIPNTILLMPFLGLIIVMMYEKAKLSGDGGTNLILQSIRDLKGVPIVIAPMIFVSTIITHFVGGSAGREGAALQLGGSIGAQVGRIFKLDSRDMNTAVMCGMGALFSALFGTPLTAAFFAMEVIAVGVLYYSAFVPCVVSSLSAYAISLLLHNGSHSYHLPAVPKLSLMPMLATGGLAVLCAFVSIIFCLTLKYTKIGFGNLIKNPYLRIIAGGFFYILLTLIFGTRYTSLGNSVILSAVNDGTANYYDFVLKMIFTAVTMAIGFKGGEIVPTMFIGSTFGCAFGTLLGLDPSFGAALGLVAVFCGVVNCPIASILLSVELFGGEGLAFFVVAVCISYMLSGYYSIYSSQRFAYSKLRAEYVNMQAN
ncbi:MAG: chloride channel protein [Ruminococcus sp.]|nr:chloride channel protein [Ruminococcus sp.]